MSMRIRHPGGRQLSELTDPETPITYGVVKPGAYDPDGVRFIRSGDHGAVVFHPLPVDAWVQLKMFGVTKHPMNRVADPAVLHLPNPAAEWQLAALIRYRWLGVQ